MLQSMREFNPPSADPKRGHSGDCRSTKNVFAEILVCLWMSCDDLDVICESPCWCMMIDVYYHCDSVATMKLSHQTTGWTHAGGSVHPVNGYMSVKEVRHCALSPAGHRQKKKPDIYTAFLQCGKCTEMWYIACPHWFFVSCLSWCLQALNYN